MKRSTLVVCPILLTVVLTACAGSLTSASDVARTRRDFCRVNASLLWLPMSSNNDKVNVFAGVTELEAEEKLLLSVNRSRKRFLSPGILRGEQAVDRLAEQEASASPFLKRSRASPPSDAGSPTTPCFSTPPSSTLESTLTENPDPIMALSAEEFRQTMSQMDGKSAVRFDSLDTKLSALTGRVNEVDANVRLNASKLVSHEALILTGQKGLQDLRREVDGMKTHQSKDWPLLPPSPSTDVDDVFHAPAPAIPDNEYMTARRSLRLCPIVGTTGEELWKSTGDFLHVLLGLKSIGESDIEKLARPQFPSSFATRHEALIVFRTVEVRDSVIGQSSRLSTKIDEQGKPTAGIRIEVPAALRPAFSTLFKFGQQLRKCHGEGTRRHVKFDDIGRSLFLNVKLPGDQTWSKVSLELASKGLRARERINSQHLEQRFDLSGEGSPRPRISSLTSAPMDTTAPSVAWTGRRSGSTTT